MVKWILTVSNSALALYPCLPQYHWCEINYSCRESWVTKQNDEGADFNSSKTSVHHTHTTKNTHIEHKLTLDFYFYFKESQEDD